VTAGERQAIIEFYRVFTGGGPHHPLALEEVLAQNRPDWAPESRRGRTATIAAGVAYSEKTEDVWRRLVHKPNPTLRSYLIERLGTSGIDPKVLKNRLDAETDTSAPSGLILALGAFHPTGLPELGSILLGLYENEKDPGVHAAAGWVCGDGSKTDQLRTIDEKMRRANASGGRAGTSISGNRLTRSTIP